MKSPIKSILFVFSFCLVGTAFGQVKDTTFLVNGVCGMCENTIEKAANLPGVSSAEWDVDSKVLTLKYDPATVSVEKVNTAINKSGYDTQFTTASDSAYYSLHKCCYYRDPKVVEDHK
jgi:copper chaperone CopZ